MKFIFIAVVGSVFNALILKLLAYFIKIENRELWKCYAISLIGICMYLFIAAKIGVNNTAVAACIYFIITTILTSYILKPPLLKGAAISAIITIPFFF